MTQPYARFAHPYRAEWIALLVFLGCYVANTTNITLFSLDEAKNAGGAAEMWRQGQFIVPTFNGDLHLDKPGLQYLFSMLTYSIFGVNEWSARFFSIVFMWATVWLHWRYLLRFTTRRLAWWGLVGLGASFHFSALAHFAVPDPYLLFFLTGAFWSFYAMAQDSATRKDWLFFYVSVGLATLAKGPVAIGLPGLVALVYLLVRKELKWNIFRRFGILPGAVVTLVVCGWWYVAVHVATDGAWTEGFFFRHNLNRFATTFEGHGGVPGLSLIYAVLSALPLGLLVPGALVLAVRNRKDPLVVFCASVIVVVVGFFSFSGTQLPNYVAPATPFLVVLLAQYLLRAEQHKRAGQWAYVLVYLLFGAGLVATPAFLVAEYPEAISLSQWYLLFSPVLIGATVGAWLFFRHHLAAATYAWVLGGLAFQAAFYFVILPALDRHTTVGRVVNTEVVDWERPMAYYKGINPAMVFYGQRVIPKLNSVEETRQFLEAHPSGLVFTQTKFADDIAHFKLDTVLLEQDLFELNRSLILEQPAPAGQ